MKRTIDPMKQLKLKASLFISVLICFLFVGTINLYGQVVLQKSELNKIASQQRIESQQKKLAAIEIANAKGYLIRSTLQNGRVVELQRIENGIPIYLTTYNLEGADLIKSSELWESGTAGFNLSGQGETLGIWDGGAVRTTHQEFGDRIIQGDGATTISEHATHVAGTMIAEGVDANAKGMSYKANLNAYDWNDDNSEMAEAAAEGLTVSQHSYGNIVGWSWGNYSGYEGWHWFGDESMNEKRDFFFGHYDHWANQWDGIAFNAPHYLMVKSAGNDRGEGPENQPVTHYVRKDGDWVASDKIRELDGGQNGFKSLGRVSTAKNILTVGAVDAAANMATFSGWGPTHDGRIKPDVVAKGVDVYSAVSSSDDSYASFNGTSMAGPMVSGSIGLLNEHYKNVSGSDQTLWSSTMKALVIHAADDTINGAPGPDYRYGWGLMNTKKSAEIISRDTAQNGFASVNELILNEGQELAYQVKASGEEPLKATIAWTDVPGPYNYDNPDTTKMVLVNDLDMRISYKKEQEFAPYILDPSTPSANAGTGDNYRDNVEVIYINETDKDSLYTLHISHKGMLENDIQAFSLIVTGGSIEQQEARSKPSNLTAQLNQYSGQVELNWDHTFLDAAEEQRFNHYQVFRSDELLETTTKKYFTEALPDTGVYNYTVVASYNDGESHPAGPVQVYWDDSILVDVWPGDANNDAYVDASDVLPIGLYYGQENGENNNPGSAWEIHQRVPWDLDGETPKRIFADTNGDGKINAADVLVIGLNYSQTHQQNNEQFTGNDPTLNEVLKYFKVEISDDQPKEGELQLDLQWNSDEPLQGLAFDVIIENKEKLQSYELDVSNSFLGDDLIVFDYDHEDESMLDIAFTNKKQPVHVENTRLGTLILNHTWKHDETVNLTFDQIITSDDRLMESVEINYVVGSGSITTSAENELPLKNHLADNYPNPFNPSTTIEYSLEKPGHVSLTIYTIAGQKVKTLVNEQKSAGVHSIRFDANSLSSGVYLYKIETTNFSKVKKLTLIK